MAHDMPDRVAQKLKARVVEELESKQSLDLFSVSVEIYLNFSE